MAKFSLKADHFITPIKLVLPGIIVSLVGASAVFFLFNNPQKNKASATHQAWNVIREYESAFSKGTEDAFCISDNLDQIKFRKDYSHLLEILINNLEDLKDNDEIDTRLKAFLNIKIARYNDAKRLTETYLDSVIALNQYAIAAPNDQRIKDLSEKTQTDYITDLGHIETRDTAELSRIADALNKEHLRYTDSFLLQTQILQPIAELKKHFMGKWRFPEIAVTAEFKKDKTGTWEVGVDTLSFTWTMDDRKLTASFKNETHNFYIVEATDSKISAYWKEKKFVVVGCRKGAAR